MVEHRICGSVVFAWAAIRWIQGMDTRMVNNSLGP